MAIISEFQEVEPQQQQAPSEQPASSENGAPLVPNSGNGLDLEHYSWTQTLQDVSVAIPVPAGTKSRSVSYELKATHIKVGLRGQPPVIDEDLHKPVKTSECFWSIEDGRSLSLLLTKQNQSEWWKSLVKGGTEVDTQKVQPEPSKLSQLEPDVRKTVEKMMFDQHQKSMGLPTSDQIQNQEMMKKLKAQYPDMDFSGARMMH